MKYASSPVADSLPVLKASRKPRSVQAAASLTALSLPLLTPLLVPPASLQAQTSTRPYAIPGSQPNIIRPGSPAPRPMNPEQARSARQRERDRKGRGREEGTEAAPLVARRVLLLLPLRLGAGWSANPVFTRGLLPRAAQALKDSLRGTGKFSIVEVHRHNPVLLRGVTDGMFTQEELDTLLREPTVENARLILSKLTFDQPPKLGFLDPPQIAEFVLERFPAGRGPGQPAVQVIGRLYNPGTPEAANTSTIVTALQGADLRPSDLTLASTALAFVRIASTFAQPLIEAEAPFLPRAGMSVTASSGTTSTTPATPDGGKPNGVAPDDLPPAPEQPAEPVPPPTTAPFEPAAPAAPPAPPKP